MDPRGLLLQTMLELAGKKALTVARVIQTVKRDQLSLMKVSTTDIRLRCLSLLSLKTTMAYE